MKSTLRRAMQDSDHYVIEMDYADAKGNRTRRLVSPIRFVGNYRFLGLCLCREAPRQFQLSRCENVRLVPASDVLMPVPMAGAEDPMAGVDPCRDPALVSATMQTEPVQACLI